MKAMHRVALMIVAALASPVWAGSRQAVPHSGGHAPRASAPSRPGGSAARSAPRQGGTAVRRAPGGAASARGTASGVARYGYGGYGYGHGYGYGYYPYYDPYYSYWGSWWYPWWGVSWYGGCWNCYGPGYAYAPYYGMDDGGGYDAAAEEAASREPARIETKISPSSAAVIVDGEDFGFAGDYDGRWDRLSVSPGKHSVAFREKGYRSLSLTIDARPGAAYVLKDALAKGEGEDSRIVATTAAQDADRAPSPLARPAATGRLRIQAEPQDAAIYLDGEYLGLAAELSRIHGALAVSTGSHRLEAARPGFSTAVKTIDVGETDLAIVELRLDPER